MGPSSTPALARRCSRATSPAMQRRIVLVTRPESSPSMGRSYVRENRQVGQKGAWHPDLTAKPVRGAALEAGSEAASVAAPDPPTSGAIAVARTSGAIPVVATAAEIPAVVTAVARTSLETGIGPTSTTT